MRILILALTLGFGLTLNAKAENSIAKKDSIHFIDGVLIMANDTISLDEFIDISARRYERAAYSRYDEATVAYLRQAVKEMAYAEKPELLKGNRETMILVSKVVAGGVLGVVVGDAITAKGTRIISNADDPRYVAGPNLSDCWFFCSEFRKDLGAFLVGGGILVAGTSIAVAGLAVIKVAAFWVAENKTTLLMSSARHNLEANRLIDKAVNRYNK